jgi:outer membrane biosynthesis protein TonB
MTQDTGPGWKKDIWKKDGQGAALSLLLHGAALLAALWYLAHRPPLSETRFRILPVELVLGGAGTQGPASSAPAAQLQIARPRPQSAPVPEGVSPQGTRQPQDELAAKLRALAQLKSPDAALPNADNSAAPSGTSGGGAGAGNAALKDFIRAQILRRWLPDLSDPGARNMPVLVRVRLLANGTISDVTIVDQERFYSDKLFRNMALSARDAALLASPIQLPPGHYEKVTTVTVDLDPKSVLR